MTERQIAFVALGVGLLALALIIGHALIPTPPAHVNDPFGLRPR